MSVQGEYVGHVTCCALIIGAKGILFSSFSSAYLYASIRQVHLSDFMLVSVAQTISCFTLSAGQDDDQSSQKAKHDVEHASAAAQ